MTRASKNPAWVAARRRLNSLSPPDPNKPKRYKRAGPEDPVAHEQRVERHAERYRAQEEKPVLTRKELADAARHRAIAVQSQALAAEIRRQRTTGEALDLQAALDACRGGKLTLPAAVASGDLTKISMALWAQNVMVLSDLAKTAPELEIRMECADRAAQRTQVMLNLIAGSGNSPLRGPRAPTVIDAPDETAAAELAQLSREEKVALVRRTLKLEGP